MVHKDSDVVHLRLEDFNPKDFASYPYKDVGPGNYEQNPRIPKIGEAGHDRDNSGEGGMTPIKLDSMEQKKVQEALGLWGFNMVASDKVNMDRIPADLRMPG